jgi:hypothetical protein
VPSIWKVVFDTTSGFDAENGPMEEDLPDGCYSYEELWKQADDRILGKGK